MIMAKTHVIVYALNMVFMPFEETHLVTPSASHLMNPELNPTLAPEHISLLVYYSPLISHSVQVFSLFHLDY